MHDLRLSRRLHSSLLLLATSAALHLEIAAQSASQQPSEWFKQLLSSPAAIEHLVYREKLPPVSDKPITPEIGIAGSTNYALFELRFQTNGLYVHSLSSENGLIGIRSSNVAFTLWNGLFCFLDAGPAAYFYRIEHERARRGDVPPAYDAAWFRVTRYAEVLNLGISHIWPGTVRWSGDRFIANGMADRKPMFVSGGISRWTNEIPCELRVVYSNEVGIARYRVAYSYKKYIPPFYPSSVTMYLQRSEREVEYRSYEILIVQPARAPMAEKEFSPDRFVQENHLQERYFTNDSVYIKLSSGKMLENRGGLGKLSLDGREMYRNRYFYAVMALVIVFFISLRFRLKTNQANHNGG